MSTSSTIELYHSAPCAVKLNGALFEAEYTSGSQFDATNCFGDVAAVVPGAKYKLVVPPALALKPNSAKPPSVSTKSISPPSLCEICTRFCASTTAITFVNPAALI